MKSMKRILRYFPAFVDKPFARSAEEADKVIKLADEKGLILTCFQNRRWVGEPQTRTAKFQALTIT